MIFVPEYVVGRVIDDIDIVGMLRAGYDRGRSIRSPRYRPDPTLTISKPNGKQNTIQGTATLRRIEIDGGFRKALKSNDRIWRIGWLPDTSADGQQDTDYNGANYLFHYAKKLKIEAFIAILAKNFFAKNAKGYCVSTTGQLF